MIGGEAMRISIGTAHLLGLKNIKIDALPTTAYLMHGEGCRRNCKFCSQARESSADSRMLSRVVWPKFDLSQVVEELTKAKEAGTLKRCCIQAVDDGSEDELAKEINGLLKSGLPLCVSKSVKTIEEIGRLLEMGVDRVTIALDVMNPEVYREVKGGSFAERWKFLLESAEAYPGRIATHLIAGLGETEQETVKIFSDLSERDVHTALFAFTPLKGTPLQEREQPAEDNYRRVQIARYLIVEHGYQVEDFQFAEQRLIGFTRPAAEALSLLTDGKAFETSGCPDCNRPYYNERPGGVLYNYPRPLTAKETYDCLKSSKLWSDLAITSALPGVNKE